jgi:hypothetical protein
MQGQQLEVVFPKDTDDVLMNDAREHYHEYGGANVRQTQGRAHEAMRGAGHETGGLMMEFHKEQALARSIELWEKRHAEFDQLPDVKRRVARGDYEFVSSVDNELRELQPGSTTQRLCPRLKLGRTAPRVHPRADVKRGACSFFGRRGRRVMPVF